MWWHLMFHCLKRNFQKAQEFFQRIAGDNFRTNHPILSKSMQKCLPHLTSTINMSYVESATHDQINTHIRENWIEKQFFLKTNNDDNYPLSSKVIHKREEGFTLLQLHQICALQSSVWSKLWTKPYKTTLKKIRRMQKVLNKAATSPPWVISRHIKMRSIISHKIFHQINTYTVPSSTLNQQAATLGFGKTKNSSHGKWAKSIDKQYTTN